MITSLTKSHNLKPKELLDIICENENFVQQSAETVSNPEIVSKLGNKYNQTVRKSLVISNKALKLLNKAAKENKIPRDHLFETLIRLFSWQLEKQAKEQKEAHERAEKIINNFWAHAEKVESDLKSILSEFDEDDPILESFGMIIVQIMNLSTAIEDELRNGTPIDPWNI